MPAISIDFIRSEINSSSVNFKYNTDEEFDLYYKFTGLSNGYFDRLKKFDFKINQNWDNTFSFMFPHIKYNSGDSFSSWVTNLHNFLIFEKLTFALCVN